MGSLCGFKGVQHSVPNFTPSLFSSFKPTKFCQRTVRFADHPERFLVPRNSSSTAIGQVQRFLSKLVHGRKTQWRYLSYPRPKIPSNFKISLHESTRTLTLWDMGNTFFFKVYLISDHLYVTLCFFWTCSKKKTGLFSLPMSMPLQRCTVKWKIKKVLLHFWCAVKYVWTQRML